jgi:hypothetical protein
VVGFAGGEVVPAQDGREEGAKVATLSSIWTIDEPSRLDNITLTLFVAKLQHKLVRD